ncbi:hypothetical protein ACSBYH_004549 [Vibrio parahaemolyticus]
MSNLTFGIPSDAVEELIKAAQDKLDHFKKTQLGEKQEISYLENEISAVSSLVEYHDLQAARENEICNLFKREDEYGATSAIPESVVVSANNRLTELEDKLKSSSQKSVKLKEKIEFLENDIKLLENMLKSSPRALMDEWL